MEDLKKKYEEYKKWIKAGAIGLGVAGLVYYGYKCYTHDAVRYVEHPAQLRASYDFIIIGAGTSGCIVARRLCEDKSRPSVLVIEAGPPDDATLFSTQQMVAACQLNQKTDIDFQFKTVSQRNSCKCLNDSQSCWPRGKVMGGSSVLNYCVYVRGSKHDFDSWENEHGCKGWGYKSILPFYKKCETINIKDPVFSKMGNETLSQYRGMNGPLSVSHRTPISQISKLYMQAAMSVGYSKTNDYNGLNDGNNDGVSHTQYTIKNGRRHSSFRAYIAPLFEEKNDSNYDISILPYSFVTRIVTANIGQNSGIGGGGGGGGGGTPQEAQELQELQEAQGAQCVATGIEFCFKDNKNKKYFVSCNHKTGGEIILCGGAVSSPQLLLLSGIGPKQDLNELGIDCVADVQGVGKNLQDHFMGLIRMTMPKEIPILNDSIAKSVGAMYNYATKGEGWLTTGQLDCHVFAHSSAKEKHGIKSKYPDLQLVCFSAEDFPDDSLNTLYYNYKANVVKTKNVSDKEALHSICGLVMIMHPTSKGYIKLSSLNPFDKPIIDPNYLSTEYDMDCAISGCEKMIEILESDVFKNLGCKIIYVNGDENIKDKRELYEKVMTGRTHTIYHPVGTCKMGNVDKDDSAVVDCKLKVKGFINLRVCDASIMPHLITGNTQAPCYMIGEKGAHHVLTDWGH